MKSDIADYDNDDVILLCEKVDKTWRSVRAGLCKLQVLFLPSSAPVPAKLAELALFLIPPAAWISSEIAGGSFLGS